MRLLQKIIHGLSWRARKWWYELHVRARIKRFFSDGLWQGIKRAFRLTIRRIRRLYWLVKRILRFLRRMIRRVIHKVVSAPIFAPFRFVLSFVLKQAGYSVVRSASLNESIRIKMTAGDSLVKASEALAFAAPLYSRENTVSDSSLSDPSEWSVSVIVPTFNDSIFLPDALESVLLQSWPHWNCYVIDDFSSQEVANVVNEVAQGDTRFKVLTHSKNLGLAASRNTGIAASSDPFIQFLDADDMLTKWSLEVRIKAIQESKIPCFGSHGQILQCPEETQLSDLSSWNHRPDVPDRSFYNANGESPFTVHAPLIKREVVEAIGGFDESYVNGAEDWEFWHRLLRTGGTFIGKSRAVGAYRQRSNSMIRDFPHLHLNRANHLLEQANLEARYADGRLAEANQPYGTGSENVVRAKRLAVWCGLRTASGWQNQIDLGRAPREILGPESMSFLLGPVPIAARNQVFSALRNGLVRGLGLSTHSLRKLANEERQVIEVAADEITSGIFEFSQKLEKESESSTWVTVNKILPDHQTVLFPAHAGDAQILESYANRPSLIVDLSSAGGDCDEAAQLSELTDSPMVSISEFMLRYKGSVPSDWVAVEPIHPAIRYLLKRFPQDINVVSESRPKSDADPEKLSFGDDYRLHIHREESFLHESSVEKLLELKDHYAGQTCVVVGNGPSLNKTPMDWVSKVPHFAVNSYFLLEEKIVRPPDFYVVEDTAVFKDNLPEIVNFEADLKIFPTIYFDQYQSVRDEEVLFFRMNQGFYGRATGALSVPRFSTRADSRLYCGQSVTIINLQLAYWFGFSKVLLVGMDFSYTVPSDALISGNHILSQSDDPNHFDPRYFGAGKTWKDPKLERVLQNYALCKSVFERDGREIINCTEGGALEIFRRSNLEQEILESANQILSE